jgi:DNA mismatch repair protein MutL
LERIALSRPDISFRFINQNQPKLQTSGNDNLKDVIYHIYGREITSQLLDVDSQEVNCTVTGFIGKPVISKGNRNFMNYFINGRYIKSNIIHKAIEDAYQPYSMQHRYPFTVLHFTINPELVDINVHPQKMEIRFTDGQAIYQSVYHALSEALKHREFIPEVTLAPEPVEPSPRTAPIREKLPKPADEVSSVPQTVQKKTDVSVPQTVQKKSDVSVPQTVQRKSDVSVLQTGQKTSDTSVRKMEQMERTDDNVSQTGQNKTTEPVQEIVQTGADDFVQESASYGTKQAEETAKQTTVSHQETLFEQGILSERARKDIIIVGQVFDTYWILQYDNAMYLVDQHAAHEKVLYERFMRQLQEKEPMTQLLQPPVILTLSLQEEQLVKEHLDIFQKLGYQIEHFGGREYAVTGVPAHLPQVGERELLQEVLDTLAEEKNSRTPEILLDKVASMSCKAAVKGNNRLPREQMEELLKELMTLENPYHCPHGRPTMIKMTKTELEKKFKRII